MDTGDFAFVLLLNSGRNFGVKMIPGLQILVENYTFVV
jgi:hypothetical protein